MMHIGTCPLGNYPRIALVVRDTTAEEGVQQAVAAGVDLLELRIDLFQYVEADHVLDVVRKYRSFPCIATIRHSAEGGEWKGSETERLHLFQTILPLVGAVDIELQSEELLSQMEWQAHESGKTVIASFHDFHNMPPASRLEKMLREAIQKKADIFKVAVCCNTNTDLRVLARFTLDHADLPLIVIGMGYTGNISRIFFPALGSLLTYTFLGEPSAPGQLNCEETLRYRTVFYPPP